MDKSKILKAYYHKGLQLDSCQASKKDHVMKCVTIPEPVRQKSKERKLKQFKIIWFNLHSSKLFQAVQ